MNIIDVHTHYGKWPFPMANVSPTEMVATLKRWDIQTAVVSSSLAIVYDFREGNRALAEAIESQPELLGYVVLNLNYPEESAREMETYLARPGFVGVKIHPLYCRQKINSPNGQWLAAKMAEYGRPLLLHTYSSPLESPWNVVPIARAFPSLPIIVAHMGGDAWQEGIAVAKEAPNLYLEPCATWADADKVAVAVREIGAERMLFGSDYTLFDPGHTLGMIEDAGLSAEERALILYGNAARLFQLEA